MGDIGQTGGEPDFGGKQAEEETINDGQIEFFFYGFKDERFWSNAEKKEVLGIEIMVTASVYEGKLRITSDDISKSLRKLRQYKLRYKISDTSQGESLASGLLEEQLDLGVFLPENCLGVSLVITAEKPPANS